MKNQCFPIRVLAEKTGVGSSTLRAWERRYGLLHPERTPKGHRLYGDVDVNRVRKIVDLLHDGHKLPDIGELLNTDATPLPAEDPSGMWLKLQQATLDAVIDFSVERVEAIYNETSSLYPIDMVTEQLLQPCIVRLGTRWKEHPESGIAEEHFYTSWLKNRLGARFHQAHAHQAGGENTGARIVLACVPGSWHEIGLMMFALSALARGYRVLYFGADLPIDQLEHIVKRSAAKAVVLGAHHQSEIADELNAALVATLPKLAVPVFLGGPDDLIDTEDFQRAGGILLGASLSVALQVLERQVPPGSFSRKYRNAGLHKGDQ